MNASMRRAIALMTAGLALLVGGCVTNSGGMSAYSYLSEIPPEKAMLSVELDLSQAFVFPKE